jgi:hypothetical protein
VSYTKKRRRGTLLYCECHIHDENMEHLGASTPGFKFFEKCDFNILENFEIMHACI